MGIDCGSQSAKVSIFDATGQPVASGRQPLQPMERPTPGVVVHPGDDLWDAIGAATQKAIAAFGQDPALIGAVGLCPIRCCKAFLDTDGQLIEPVISWMDDRAYQPYRPTDPRLAWATTASGYLTHRFTGKTLDTVANCIELQWPVNTSGRQWAPEAMADFAVDPAQLFTLVEPGETLGTVTAEAAAFTGLAAGTPVVATANDKAVELLGAGPLPASSALVSLGTYIAGMVTGDRNRSGDSFFTNFSSTPGGYLYESGGVRRGMWTLTWFLDLLGPEFAAHVKQQGSTREDWLEREAREVPPGADGLQAVLDWLAPTDAPFRKGSLLGFDARHTRAHIYRAILEAIALTMHGHLTAMSAELDRPLRELVISGGGANSALFMQIFADVFGVPAHRSSGPAGAALGAAMCAAPAAGMYATIADASAAMSPPRETFAPRPDATSRYRDMATARAGVRTQTDPIYQQSFPLFDT